jgi:hypothetical protein
MKALSSLLFEIGILRWSLNYRDPILLRRKINFTYDDALISFVVSLPWTPRGIIQVPSATLKSYSVSLLESLANRVVIECKNLSGFFTLLHGYCFFLLWIILSLFWNLFWISELWKFFLLSRKKPLFQWILNPTTTHRFCYLVAVAIKCFGGDIQILHSPQTRMTINQLAADKTKKKTSRFSCFRCAFVPIDSYVFARYRSTSNGTGCFCSWMLAFH